MVNAGRRVVEGRPAPVPLVTDEAYGRMMVLPVAGDRPPDVCAEVRVPLMEPLVERAGPPVLDGPAKAAPVVEVSGPVAPWRGPDSRWRRRRERRAAAARLQAAQLAAARRAELHHMAGVLAQAASLVERGWVQDGWLRVSTGTGTRTITSRSLGLVDEQAVIGGCLVGAVVHGVGLSRVSSQLTRRSLDVVWQTLSGGPVRPGRACAPDVHRARVRDLTRWNDTPGRRPEEVSQLLRRASGHVREAAASC